MKWEQDEKQVVDVLHVLHIICLSEYMNSFNSGLKIDSKALVAYYDLGLQLLTSLHEEAGRYLSSAVLPKLVWAAVPPFLPGCTLSIMQHNNPTPPMSYSYSDILN